MNDNYKKCKKKRRVVENSEEMFNPETTKSNLSIANLKSSDNWLSKPKRIDRKVESAILDLVNGYKEDDINRLTTHSNSICKKEVYSSENSNESFNSLKKHLSSAVKSTNLNTDSSSNYTNLKRKAVKNDNASKKKRRKKMIDDTFVNVSSIKSKDDCYYSLIKNEILEDNRNEFNKDNSLHMHFEKNISCFQECPIKSSNFKNEGTPTLNSSLESNLLQQSNLLEDSKKTKKHNKIRKSVLHSLEYKEVLENIENASQNNCLSYEYIDMLVNLEIKNNWPIAASHMIETRMTSRPTKEQQQQLKAFTMKHGFYTKQEESVIKSNWKRFYKEYSIPDDPTPFLSLTYGKSIYLNPMQRLNFVRYLARGLENRMLNSVYSKFQNMFSKLVRGKFSEDEDEIIMQYIKYSEKNNKFSNLAIVLNRSRDSVKKRYLALKEKNQKLNWSNDLTQVLLNQLMNLKNKETIEELVGIVVEYKDWKKIAAKMNVSPRKLKRKWMNSLYPALFTKHHDTLQEIRFKLLKMIKKRNISDRKNIDWKEFATHFDNITPQRLNRIFSDMVLNYTSLDPDEDFSDTVLFLKGNLKKMKNKKIIKLSYKGRTLMI